ncbi:MULTISPECIES: type I-E CRISPR-associated protein Cse2/CasB [Aerococcus]|uniref:Type I-E CRISPR-associated protein Cse2/CasB n=1 Tax=Aerococcus sanguinicola TaxID=119206 RepID=A0A5N1GMV7_9LACT|nr:MULTISPECIES: type I-E CRISPR-associated protein Cse2/CasB [Aerococcus]KAA9302305.1 type I-E CRISPR-associated protein Cse2/CasB [Aerococcus sanguinicola]MDK6369060.1 type I-E CRISPR-associated protein Cse2/CasB [Aerococcus sp. UMB9870]MDK6678962.1 type I-E CRISPR-associated protein Cse2/CasB [Aerococcus sp. UMB8608]MDK6686553.1 type I-E CRISPR-associated protein Cse2/CasB [Aerococcus sp. UMB8623]MDK6939621.1 type I-E CRISPR-associated protein Cse2/CasB [Aerococcus sp. UMB8487]
MTKRIQLSQVTERLLHQLSHSLDQPVTKARLASLRHSIGRDMSQSIEIWPFIFENIPEDYLGQSSILTDQEEAILLTLQLYAVYQQGKDQAVWTDEVDRRKNFGHSLAYLRRNEENKVATDRRFNAMITATTYEEFKYHLRQMLQLLKSKTKAEVPINFGGLSRDIYKVKGDRYDFKHDRPYVESLRLSWAKAYYSYQSNETDKEKETDND